MTADRRPKPCLGVALALALALIVIASTPAAADGPTVSASVSPPSWAALPDEADGLAVSSQGTVAWKVVYVVGVVDGSTDLYVSEAEANAAVMRGLGMTVVTFYPPNNAWADIVAEAADANVLVYAGHGMAWGSEGDSLVVGGFSLGAANKVSPDLIRSDLRMAANGIVVLNHVCFASGSATDPGLPSAEAQRRVAQYSAPFLDAGLAGYYSNWYGTFPAALLTDLATGMTLGAAYESFADFGASTVERYAHPSHGDRAMWLDKDDWGGVMYNYAFVGDEGLVPLTAAGSGATIGIGQESLAVRSEPGAGAVSYTFTVTVSDGVQAGWTAWLDADAASWATVSPTSGTAGDGLQVTITVPAAIGTYTTRLNIHTDDARVGEPDATVTITLVVEAPAAHGAYLPLLAG